MNAGFSFLHTLIILAIRTPIIGVIDGAMAIIPISANAFGTIESFIKASSSKKAKAVPVTLAHQNVLGFDECHSLYLTTCKMTISVIIIDPTAAMVIAATGLKPNSRADIIPTT